MTAAIQIRDLGKTFRGKRGAKVEALKGLDLTVNSGEVFGYLGPNGAGKSTTIKILTGQVRATRGTALLFGKAAALPASRQKVGYLPENPALYEYLTAREYLGYVGRIYRMDGAAIRSRSGVILEQLDLTHAADRRIRSYSKGMVQRLGIAQTLLHDPELYILDEPMSGLDPVGRALVKDIILELKGRGKTVFFSTHIISDVEAVCDRVAILAQGELRSENEVADLVEQSVDGYRVRLGSAPPEALRSYLVAEDEQLKTLYVPASEFSAFMRGVDAAGCEIRLVEPCRHSLESFFLKTIA